MDGETDIAIAQDFAFARFPDANYKKVAPYNVYIAIGYDHHLASDSLSLNDLREETMYTIVMDGEKADADAIRTRLNLRGFTPKRIVCVPNFLTLIHAISENKGYAICGRFKIFGAEKIRYFPIQPDDNKASIVIAWNSKKLSDESRRFISMFD